MHITKLIVIVAILQSLLVSSAYAFVEVYEQNKSPYDQQRKGNNYTLDNPYDHKNPNNIYSQFRAPYDPKSVFNNYNQYTQPVRSFNGRYEGNINGQVTDRNSINNPYSRYGDGYSYANADLPYDKTNNGNIPYSDFREPYNPKSINQSPKYALQITNNQGQSIGTVGPPYYNQNSVTIPYSKNGNPYNSGNLSNSYSHSPYTNMSNAYSRNSYNKNN